MSGSEKVDIDALMKAASALRLSVRQAQDRLTEARVRLEQAEETAAKSKAALKKLGFDPSRADVPTQIKKKVDAAEAALRTIEDALDDVEEALRGNE